MVCCGFILLAFTSAGACLLACMIEREGGGGDNSKIRSRRGRRKEDGERRYRKEEKLRKGDEGHEKLEKHEGKEKRNKQRL